MSLINCHECNHKVSSEAAACPHCGAAPRIPIPISSEERWRTRKILIIGAFSFFIAYAVFNAYSEWADKRAAKKAEVEEFFRRESLTSEQRIAEDTFKAARTAEEAAAKKQESERIARNERERTSAYACRQALIGTLHDPSSFTFTESYGAADESGIYHSYIEGRAKNAFGALINGKWKCEIAESGPNLIINSVTQISPRRR